MRLNRIIHTLLYFFAMAMAVGAQSLSVADIEKVFTLVDGDQVNVFFKSRGWEGIACVVDGNYFDVSLQLNGAEDVVVKQDSSKNRFLSYRLHKQEAIDGYLANKKNFKGYQSLPSTDKNYSAFRKGNALHSMSMNRTRGILTIRYEVRSDQAFWNSVSDRCSRTSDLVVGAYLPAQGGVLIGFSPDGKTGYVAAMNDAKRGNGCCWSNKALTIDGVFSSTDWNLAHDDYSGKTNTENICKHLAAAPEFQQRAAQIAAEFESDGFSDWFLPSIAQLMMIADNKADIDETLSENGGTKIANTWYWSSSQCGPRMVWTYNFKSKYMGQSSKDGHDRVRPVREFKIKEASINCFE